MNKVDKAKIKTALARYQKENNQELVDEYHARLASELKYAQESLERAIKEMPGKRKAVQAKQKLLNDFLRDKKVPEAFTGWGRAGQQRQLLHRLMKKVELVKGDTVNLTDAEFALL